MKAMRLLLFSLFALIVFSACGTKTNYETEPMDSKNPIVKMETSEGDIYIELYEKDAPKTVENFIGLAEGTKEFTDPNTKAKVVRPFYDGLIFHRVIDGFMIQGGCPLGKGTGNPGYKFEDEINAKALGLDTTMVAEAPYAGRDAQMYIINKLGITSQQEFQDRMEEVQQAFSEVSSLNLYEVYSTLGYAYDESLNSHQAVRGVIAMANSGPNTNGSQFFINQVDTPHLNGKHTVFGKVIQGMDIVDKICKLPVDQASKPQQEVKIISVRVHEKSEHSS